MTNPFFVHDYYFHCKILLEDNSNWEKYWLQVVEFYTKFKVYCHTNNWSFFFSCFEVLCVFFFFALFFVFARWIVFVWSMIDLQLLLLYSVVYLTYEFLPLDRHLKYDWFSVFKLTFFLPISPLHIYYC